MREVVLSIPDVEKEQNIEIEVKINGKKEKLNYKVEILNWRKENSDPNTKVDTLKHYINEHDKDWKLVQIGIPDNGTIPIMFKKNEK